MKVYRSNRMDVLSGHLAEVLRRPVEGETAPSARALVMNPDVVVVHSLGMARWLEMSLARALGVCANVSFPFPAGMVRQSICAVLDVPDTAWTAWQPDTLMWPTLEALADTLASPPFAPLAQYLTGRAGADSEPAACLGGADGVLLAREIADVFDRYITYRPDMVLRWETETGGDDWQPVLWRALVERVGSPHVAALYEQFQRAIAGGVAVDPARLPPRICVFGVSTLPPFYLDVFSALSHIRDVHLFVLCPSDAYWGDIRSKREQARTLRQAERGEEGSSGLTLETLHLQEGNPLLASYGRLGRDFQVVLEGQESPYVSTEVDEFVEPSTSGRSLLRVLQSDILHVRHRGGLMDIEPPIPPIPGDDSIRTHACYGDMRQVEALRDDLLSRFAADETLQPRDVVVMTPDIERFAPLVEAVFGDDAARPVIPYRIADRTMAKANPIAEVLTRLLDLAGSRLPATEVMDLLVMEPVRKRFELLEDDLPKLEEWIRTSGIRWGVDEADRVRHRQPSYLENTWRFGLDRMLLGVAMPGQQQSTFGGTLPFDEIEGGDALTLGRLAEACETLFSSLQTLQAPRSASEWAKILQALIERMVQVADTDLWKLHSVTQALRAIGQEADDADCTRPLDLAAIRALVSRRLAQPRRAAGFLTGAVTFCALVPMRSVPFRVVVLMGMDEDVFPRKGRRVGFDRTLHGPRLGDRNPREEDRYLILEALLAARDALVITYAGFDPQTGEEKAPATPIDELHEVVAASMDWPENQTPWVTHHPLQAFSPTLFDASGPISYDERRLPAAKRMLEETQPKPPFFGAPVAAPNEELVSLDALANFFKHPSKYFLHRRMGVYIPGDEDAVDDREPMAIERGLGDWMLRDASLGQRLDGDDWDAIYERLRLRGVLPLGRPGRMALDQIAPVVDQIVAAAAPHWVGASEQERVDLSIGGVRIVGQLDHLRPSGRVMVQASKPRPKYQVDLWVRHLVYRLVRPSAPGASYLFGAKESVSLGPGLDVAAARQHLEQLVALYRWGQQAPLLFFPATSWAFIQKLRNPSTRGSLPPEAQAFNAARKAWEGSTYVSGERDDYHGALFEDRIPCAPDFSLPGVPADPDTSFATVAAAIWDPYCGEVVE